MNRIEEKNISKQFCEEFVPLLTVFSKVVHNEWIESKETINPGKYKENHTLICDYCKCDIWNRCFHCSKCGSDGGYDICLECVADGRGCIHRQDLELIEHVSMKHCKDVLERGIKAYLKACELVNIKPVEICQNIPHKSHATLAFERIQLYKRVSVNTRIFIFLKRMIKYNIVINVGYKNIIILLLHVMIVDWCIVIAVYGIDMV